MQESKALALEQLHPRALEESIKADDDACSSVLDYLDERKIAHRGEITGAVLASVCGVDGRTWRKWVGDERPMPLGAKRALICAAGWCEHG